ncbi:MAG: hypothetical protein FJ267_13540 [Planctomycetes bacterium]|nr:hypothetical protein [Planctomycetota bacterium]
MKTWLSSGMFAFGLFCVLGSMPDRQQNDPLRLDLAKPGDALIITLNGKHVGGLRVDSEGRLGIYGPNQSSTAITIDGQDRVQIDPAPVAEPPVRLTVAEDVWMTGVLRVGRADAFGDAPFDPNGAIQVGRNLPVAQPMSVFRTFAQGKERFRLGISGEGHGFWSNGPHDTPLVTFRGLSEDKTESGLIEFHATTKEGAHK